MGEQSAARVETNVFVLENLEDISSRYRLYRIVGLDSEHPEYYENRQAIIRKLSYTLRNPVTIIDRDGQPHLVVRDDAPAALDPLPLVRVKVRFEPSSDAIELDYAHRSSENDIICLRFLNFMLQAALRARTGLWQPSSGQPFFPRVPNHTVGQVAQYRGFSVRAGVISNGQLGLCVDIKHRYVSVKPLPRILSRDEFSRWKKRQCIYHYGHRWYQFQITSLSDDNVVGHEVLRNGEWVPLLDYIIGESKKPLPPELANLPVDTSVVLYRNNRNEERAAPTLLCYPTYGTEDRITSKLHRKSIMLPHVRRRTIQKFVKKHLGNLRFGDSQIQLSVRLTAIPSRVFQVPDIKFGNNKVLSVRSTPDTQQISLDRLGQARIAFLYDEDAGFFEQDPLHQQYLVLPQSVVDTYGDRFKEDLCTEVDNLYPQKTGYKPDVIPYNDRGPRTYLHQGKEILKAVDVARREPGYAVVMVHHTEDRKLREEDQLAALVMRELAPRIKAAIIHSEVGQECYEAHWEGDEVTYAPVNDKKRDKLKGYLRNVALNQVLLNNRRWPFVLATSLHADITIGLDLKNNVVGFVVVGKRGESVWWDSKVSSQKQRMNKRQIKAYLLEILRKELQTYVEQPMTIVLHRDGRTYPSELEGALEAIDQLKDENLLQPDASLTVVEISKSAPVSLRLFEVTERAGGRLWIDNPQVGRYYLVNDTDGYICATGRPFSKKGTVAPLHVSKVQGSMLLEQCLEDVFSLTCLAWTRPEDCTRYPITIKLNDILLSAEAGLYDQEALDIETILDEESETNE
jgi:hypothetical protein